MKKFCVTMYEIHSQDVIVEAKNKKEALDKVQEGEGVFGESDHKENLPTEEWNVEEITN